MHLALGMQFAVIITFRGVIVVSCNKVGVVTNHDVTASAGVTRGLFLESPGNFNETGFTE